MIVIINILLVLVALASILGLVVVVRQYQWALQLNELEAEIEELEAESDLRGPNYFISCEIDFLNRKRNRIKEKLFF